MKRRTIAFTVMLCAVVLARLCLPVFAELGNDAGVSPEVQKTYVAGVEQPVVGRIPIDVSAGEGAQTEYREFSFTADYAGEQARALVGFTAVNRVMTDADWNAVRVWLNKLIARAIPTAGNMDAAQMALRMHEAVLGARAQAKPDENGALPVWAEEAIAPTLVSAEAPYYPELKRGDRGGDVAALQQKLATLGYLTGKADGQFGPATAQAVMAIQTQLRAMEQAEIDAMPTPEPTATPLPEASPEAAEATPDAPVPTPEAPAYEKPEPATAVNGVADLSFQIRLNSGLFPLVTDAPDADAVTRLQNRLLALGCMTGKADGLYGGDTRRAVRIFQYYNDLPQTGEADADTQRIIFSDAAKSPDYPLMAQGSSGAEVKKLQSRLILLGFMGGTADGDFGRTTKVGVENLQSYLREREIDALTRQALRDHRVVIAPDAQPGEAEEGEAVTPAPNTYPDAAAALKALGVEIVPTVAVNGVADPLLLDEFYAGAFPAIPDIQKNGAANGDVKRIQRRLYALEYLYGSADGNFGDGTEDAVRAFQKRNGLAQDGVAGRETMVRLFSADAKKALKPYLLKVSTAKQRVYAYGLDENEEHTVLVRTMECSTGRNDTPTPKGTFQSSTGPGARWHYFKKFYCWAQYAYYIQGDIMFHSVLYGSKGGAVTSSSVRNLGSKASHGCVRLAVEDAKWIWEHCPPNTKVVVY